MTNPVSSIPYTRQVETSAPPRKPCLSKQMRNTLLATIAAVGLICGLVACHVPGNMIAIASIGGVAGIGIANRFSNDDVPAEDRSYFRGRDDRGTGAGARGLR
jgi:hypothetical protein